MKTEIVSEQSLPANLDAERVILGSILLNPDTFFAASSELLSEHFSLDSHRKIYAAICHVATEQQPIEYLTVYNELRRRDQAANVGGMAYVCSLSDGVPARVNLSWHVKQLRQKYALRRLIESANLLTSRCMDQVDDPDKIASEFEAEIGEIASEMRGTSGEAKKIGDYAAEVFEEIEAAKTHTGKLIGLSYGLHNLNFTTTGMRPGEITVVGGRPGAGKSSFALGTALANAEEGIGVYYASAEMSGPSLFRRTLSAIARVNNFKLRDPKRLTIDEDKALLQARRETRDFPLWVDDRAGMHIDRVLSRARLMVRKNGVRLVILDYCQIIRADGDNRFERVGNVAEAVAHFARAENIHCLLLSQLRRAEKKVKVDAPTMDELKESGRLEENADVVILLHRGEGQALGEDEAIIAKQRNGPTTIEKVFFDKTQLMYRDRE